MSDAKQDAPEEAPVESTAADGFDDLEPDAASLTEFPSLHGQSDVEVAQRTVDTDDAATDVHRKVFVLTRSDYGTGKGFDHEPNERATKQFMVQHGLRPLGDVSFDGAKKLPDGKSVALAYTVQAVPAVIATGDAAHLVIE